VISLGDKKSKKGKDSGRTSAKVVGQERGVNERAFDKTLSGGVEGTQAGLISSSSATGVSKVAGEW